MPKSSTRSKAAGWKYGAWWGFLIGVVAAVIIGIVGFSYLDTVTTEETRASEAEWGTAPQTVPVTERGALMWSDSLMSSVQQVTVQYGAHPLRTVLLRTDYGVEDTVQVWHNNRTDEILVVGDVNDPFGYAQPPRIGDHTGLIALIILLILIALAGCWLMGAALADRYDPHGPPLNQKN